MGYPEKRGESWVARYKDAAGAYPSVRNTDGSVARFRTKRLAQSAADEAEVRLRSGARPAGPRVRVGFADWANEWYAEQDLAPSTMQNYRHHIEEHLLPAFQELAVDEITAAHIGTWERKERAAGYAASSVKTWRATLHLLLADATDRGLIPANVATKRRGRGKRAGRSRHRSPEKAVTTVLGLLLLAERMALLSGRDDEFVQTVLMGFTGMRWAEVVGLEPKFMRPTGVRVEWQLYELDNGEFVRCPPKDDSYRAIVTPGFVLDLVREHLRRRQPAPCACHGLAYVFGGHRSANGAAQVPGAKLVDVARHAGVSTGTVSAVLNARPSVADVTRVKVQASIAELGYMAGGSVAELTSHQRRNGFSMWLFQPAATGWYPARAPRPARPVPLVGEPWPGVPVRGRNAAGRATACWLPIAPGLTPHGLRHTYKTLMEQLGAPPVLQDAQMGHQDGSVQARYSHVTDAMSVTLLLGLDGLWAEALDRRREMHPHSPVRALNRLLREAQA